MNQLDNKAVMSKLRMEAGRGSLWPKGGTLQQLLHLATQTDHCVTNYGAVQLCHLPGPL